MIRRILPATVILLCLLASAPTGAEAQAITYTQGQPVYPAYEGWRRGDDGGYILMFGYMNQNWEQTPLVPVGSDNYLSPDRRTGGSPRCSCHVATASSSKYRCRRASVKTTSSPGR